VNCQNYQSPRKNAEESFRSLGCLPPSLFFLTGCVTQVLSYRLGLT